MADMPNLVATAKGPGAFEGSGIVADIAGTAKAMGEGSAGGIAGGAFSTVMDALSLVAAPLAGLLGAGIGWLIEHVSFLREPLDKLCGNPGAIQAESETWKN